jgi:hypothetical protein
MAAVGADGKDLAIWTSPAWAAAAPFLLLGGEGWGRATAADAAVPNDLASDGKGHLRERAKRAFLTGRRRPAGSEVASEERGRGPDPEGWDGRSFMYGAHELTFRVGVPICTKCWRFGHRFTVCPFRAQLCAHCAGPHHTDHHRVLGACCKAQPKANPPRAATPGGNPCPHPPRCVNCGLDHMSNNMKCSFWKHRFDAKWVQKKYTAMKVGDELLRFMPLPNTSFPNVVGARLPRHLPGTRSFQQEVD